MEGAFNVVFLRVRAECDHHAINVRVCIVWKTGYIRWNGLKQAKQLPARVDSKHAGCIDLVEERPSPTAAILRCPPQKARVS